MRGFYFAERALSPVRELLAAQLDYTTIAYTLCRAGHFQSLSHSTKESYDVRQFYKAQMRQYSKKYLCLNISR